MSNYCLNTRIGSFELIAENFFKEFSSGKITRISGITLDAVGLGWVKYDIFTKKACRLGGNSGVLWKAGNKKNNFILCTFFCSGFYGWVFKISSASGEYGG